MPPAVLPKANVAAVRDALEGIDPEEPPERRNTILGEALFPLVQQLTMDQAAVPKITGYGRMLAKGFCCCCCLLTSFHLVVVVY